MARWRKAPQSRAVEQVKHRRGNRSGWAQGHRHSGSALGCAAVLDAVAALGISAPDAIEPDAHLVRIVSMLTKMIGQDANNPGTGARLYRTDITCSMARWRTAPQSRAVEQVKHRRG